MPASSVTFVYGLSLDGEVRYVGQTSVGARRRYAARPPARLRRPVDIWQRKHWEHITMELLEECELGTIDERETWWIEHLGTLWPNGLNLLPGGRSTRGYTYSDAQRQNVSAGVKRAWEDPAYRARVTSEASVAVRRAAMLEPEERARRTAENLRRFETDEARKQHGAAMRAWGDANPGKLQLGGRITSHNRWHVGRGITKEGCELCGLQTEEAGVAGD